MADDVFEDDPQVLPDLLNLNDPDTIQFSSNPMVPGAVAFNGSAAPTPLS